VHRVISNSTISFTDVPDKRAAFAARP
jgi:hypothetical protein